MQQITIGTAGHIDHGKSSLVWALTGTHPDRLKAEQERGLTLELGFAQLRLAVDKQVAFVDVPGHEDLVGQMIAGAQGFSGVLFVVAADEGLKPQSLEHYHLCELLGIKQGILVLTKVDLVLPERLEMLKLELAEFFQGGFLEQAPIAEVDCLHHRGIEGLKNQLKKQFFPGRPIQGDFRMPLDRVFSLKGFGTVVSGTVLSGQFSLDQPLWLYPEEKPLKVRGLQSNREPVSSLRQSMRGAVNLVGVSTDQLDRGMQLAAPNSLVNTQKIGVFLSPLEPDLKRLKPRKPIKLYGQTSFALGRLLPLKAGVDLGELDYRWLQLDRPLSLKFGDRLVLRGGSPERSLAGAEVLALTGPLNRREAKDTHVRLQQLHQGDLEARVIQVVYFSGTTGISKDQLGPRVGGTPKQIERAVGRALALQKLVKLDLQKNLLIHPEPLRRWVGYLCGLVQEAERSFPQNPGVELDALWGKLDPPQARPKLLGLLGWAVKENLLVKTGKFYHLKGFEGQLNLEGQTQTICLLEALSQANPQCPSLTCLSEKIGQSREQTFGLLKRAQTQGLVVAVAENLFYQTKDIHQIWSRLQRYLFDQGTITVIQFKQLLGLARKPAILLLEYFDDQGYTQRSGEARRLVSKGQDD